LHSAVAAAQRFISLSSSGPILFCVATFLLAKLPSSVCIRGFVASDEDPRLSVQRLSSYKAPQVKLLAPPVVVVFLS
jgi:hypothetical protein